MFIGPNVDIIISIIKSKFGGTLKVRKFGNQVKEIKVKLIV